MPSEDGTPNGHSGIIEENPNLFGQLPFLTERILRRRQLVSCTSSCENVLDAFINSCQGLDPPVSPGRSEMVEEFLGWKQWRSRCLSYMLNKRTIKMLSGANLIFSASKEHWMKVFEHSINSSEENFLEVMDKDILDYVTVTLTGQLHKLCLVQPVLISAAIPPWCPLFKIYMSELEKQFDGTSTIRCDCSRDENQLHQRCEIGESIRCLYIFHLILSVPNA
ncbi:fanconi anemia group F protein (FANCF) [Rhynchospora pubera]|uniref:Fanconi anemia group F protein (FANCF) n=1 Tax=Rhynchospora pubera TaxID=906938 RepID=A0AAV8EPJ6_9POAL|nr:fanconi anemia group F protein (FANCF) [Rhynchospora pubera]